MLVLQKSNVTTPRGITRVRLRLKCDGTRAETRFRLSSKRTSPFNLLAPEFGI